MYVGADFSPVDVGEVISEAFDFVNDLAPGDSISGAVWTCGIAKESSGVDAAASSRMLGPAGVSGTVTSQRFAGFLPGVTYLLTAIITTTLGDTLDLWSHVYCETPN